MKTAASILFACLVLATPASAGSWLGIDAVGEDEDTRPTSSAGNTSAPAARGPTTDATDKSSGGRGVVVPPVWRKYTCPPQLRLCL